MKILKLLWKNFQNKNLQMNNIFIEGFENWKFYSFRLNYSLSDYRNWRIQKCSYQTINRSIWITINAWIIIISMATMIYYKNNPYLLNLHHIERIYNVNRYDLLIIDLIFCFIILEYMWLHLFNEVINYRSSINNFFITNIPFDCKKLKSKSLEYLISLYSFTNFFAKLLHRIVVISLIMIYSLFIVLALILYVKEQINLIQMISSLPFLGFITLHLMYLMGQMFINLNFILFLVEYFQIRMKHLLHISKWASNNQMMITTNINGEYRRRIFWNNFHHKYLQLYSETISFSPTLGIVLFTLEMMSKSSIVISMLFYVRQTHMNLFIIVSLMIALMVFCFPIILYSRVARLPSYNQLCSRYMLNWSSRPQWLLLIGNRNNNNNGNNNFIKTTTTTNYRSRIQHYSLKSTLFVQTMNNNRFGFKCGHLFFITKFRYIQLLIFNIHLLLKFYKKLIHSSSTNL